MRALVFSGGGMFGAYQVGAWKVLSQHFEPDIVVGASIGSLNAWMVAAGCSAADLEKHWLEGDDLAAWRFRFPLALRQGLLDPVKAHAVMQRMHRELKPKLQVGILARKGWRLRPVLFQGDQITWNHLAASCAIPVVFDQPAIDGTTYTDGGLLDPLPLFAARQMGATKILGLNCMTWGGFGKIEAIHLRPNRRLGLTPQSALCWNLTRVRKWIAQGEADARKIIPEVKRLSDGPESAAAEFQRIA